jgi:hypothetical protein
MPSRHTPLPARFTIALTLASVLLATPTSAAAVEVKGKKVLFVNSYHAGYAWSDGEERGARGVLGPAGVELRFFRMDTKRHQGSAFSRQAAELARAEIAAYRPDLVIVADDPAVGFLLAPYYRDAALPFVFCGVNWDAAKYGLPFGNTTGMVEIGLVRLVLDGLRPHARGERVGFLSADSETERIEAPYYKKALGLTFEKQQLVRTMAEWRQAFVEMQGRVDLLLLGNIAGINDWNEAEMTAFVREHSRIPSGAMFDHMMHYAMLGFTKVPEEQGAWAGRAALEILQGKPPGAIRVTANQQARILINKRLAARAGVNFRPEQLRSAELVE